MRLAVVIANLGGPDGPEAVRPFLANLFGDAAIIALPQPFRFMLAQVLASRRAPVAAKIYARIGGSSPILAETEAQAVALERALGARLAPDTCAKVFVAMRYWHPFAQETAAAVRAWTPDCIVLLPLYPQFSTTTTASFFEAWDRAAGDLAAPTARLCCHPSTAGFIAAHRALLLPLIGKAEAQGPYRLLFSAHGLPQRIAAKGDPYPQQVEESARAIVSALDMPGLDWRICYQSRVGPLAWLEPSTEAEIDRCGQEGKGIVLVPIAFVSEHSETLVELDLDYAARARACGVPFYRRVPALGTQPLYMDALAELALRLAGETGVRPPEEKRLCPGGPRACPARTALSENAA